MPLGSVERSTFSHEPTYNKIRELAHALQAWSTACRILDTAEKIKEAEKKRIEAI